MQTPNSENTSIAIKKLKAKKNLINSIVSNKKKNLLMNNDNVMKCYAYEQFIKNHQSFLETKEIDNANK